MSVLFGLLSALTFGSGDFLAGIVSRRLAPSIAAASVQVISLCVAVVAILFYPGEGLTGHVFIWGVVGGIGTTCGVLALYKGFSVGRMSVAATLSGLLGAVIPAIFGLATGDSLTAVGLLGVVIAVPAIGLVSWQPEESSGSGGSGALWGILSGTTGSLLFIGYDQAGSGAGAWPLLVGTVTATVLTLGPALVAFRRGSAIGGGTWERRETLMLLGAGLLIGTGNLFFLVANHLGELAVAAVLTGLYPGFTVILARVFLHEHWSAWQKAGLIAALSAALLVGLGA